MNTTIIILASMCGLIVSSVYEDNQRRIKEGINGIKTNLNRIGDEIESLKSQGIRADEKIRGLKEGPRFYNCNWTGYLNGLDQSIKYWIPNNTVLTGLHSIHNDWFQDREWKVQICHVRYGN